MRAARRYAIAVTLLALLVACSSGGSKAVPKNARPAPPSTIARVPSTGTITGRYYADGGPWPIGNQPPRPIIGTITVTNTETNTVYHATENRAGYFRLTVPVGSYQVVARARWIGFPLTKSAAVTPTAIVNVDLGIHMT